MSAADTNTKARKRARITVSGDGLSATLLLTRPLDDEPQITFDEVMTQIQEAGVVYGLDEDTIRQCVEECQYNNPIPIATGKRPQQGQTSTFEFHFDTEAKGKPKEDDDGRIDYKDISFIQNVEKDAVLITKTPPTPGVPGKTVRGKDLKAPDGRDLPFKNGINTEVSSDGLTLHATASGAILYQFGKVSVNDLTIIKGDVDSSVGNIDCRGSVRVAGDIKAGFSLKIDGDLEVGGHVEDSTIEVGGNISVKGGFFGKGDGVMKADGDITVKYAEGQKMVAGGSIMVGGEIIKCDLRAKGTVAVMGKKGKIFGGEVKAGKKIQASVLGNDTGTRTHLYVAYNHELMVKYRDTINELQRLKEDGERVKEALVGLYRLQMDGALPPGKQQALDKLTKFKKDLPGTIEALEKQKAETEEKLAEYRDACVVAEAMLYPGVTVHFGPVYKDIVEERKRCRIIIEGNKILMTEYSETV